MTRPTRGVALALAVILAGDALAWWAQTDGGRIRVEDVRWTGGGGSRMSGLLYVPNGVDAASPAPAVLAIHGYINTRETQDGFAIELARRGFVVLAPDQTGHGYSDPPAFGNGFGGPDALAYLRSLDIVDPGNVALEGHSMGGWAVLVAAAAFPDGYRSVVLEGSSPGTFGAPPATPGSPRNLAVVFSRYDEFSGLMWLTPVAADVPGSPKLEAAFGTSEPVVPGRVYGSIEDGTARVFHQPRVTHPGDHFSAVAIGHAIDWVQATLDGGDERPSDDQIWRWKEVGTLVGALGMVLLLLAAGELLLGVPFFAELASEPRRSRGARGAGWWLAAAVFALLPPATLFRFKGLAEGWTASALLPQSLTTQIATWAVLVGAITSVLLLAWHYALNRRTGATADDYGLTRGGRIEPRRVAKSLLLALLVVGAAYAATVLTGVVFTTDFRFWVFAIKPMSLLQMRIFLSYVLPFAAFFTVFGVALNGQLRRDDLGPRAQPLVAVALSVTGFVGLLAYQYVPLLAGGTLASPGQALWCILAFQFPPLMTIVAVVTVSFFRRTGSVYPGAFASALLVTWIVVASQATHFAF